MNVLVWLFRKVCALLFVAAMLAGFVGFLAYDRGGRDFLVRAFPRLQPLVTQLHPHAVQMMIGCGLAAVAFFLVGGGAVAIKGRPSIVHGSAHFASWHEIWRAGFAPGRSHTRLVLGRRGVQTVAVSEARQCEHVMLMAPTGQGKTSGVIIPGLLEERGTRGLLVNDVKGELHETCAGALGHHMSVSVFAPLRPGISVQYNPLAHVKTVEDAENLAAAWVQNTTVAREPYWNDTARLLMTAVILHLQEAEPGAPFSRLADILGAATFDQVRVILSTSPSILARDLGASFLNNVSADPKLAGGLMSGMATRFLMMRNPTIRALTSTDPDAAKNITFERLIDDPQALFLSVPAQDARRLKPLTACLLMQLMTSLARKKGDRGFAFYLDELC
nr:type IV secretory system conjugative DNA transfer family protein [Chloroflexota bacterium]